MISELLTLIRHNKSLFRWLLIGAVVLVIVAVVTFVSQRIVTEKYSLGSTNLRAEDNFGYLNGTELYAYNGMGFYKTNVTDGDTVTILSSGMKLPTPSHITWANSQGALINFASSFSLTEIETELEQRDQQVNPRTELYTWYINFSDNSIHLVDTAPIQASLAYFSEDDGGFYYISDATVATRGDAEYIDPGTTGSPLRFYDVATKKSSLITNDLGVTDLRYIGSCTVGSQQRPCLIARKSDDIAALRLYAILPSGETQELLSSTGRLLATNMPELFITTEQEAVEPHNEDDHNDDAGIPEVEPDVNLASTAAVVHNLAKDTEENVGIKIANQEIIPYFASGDGYYVLNSDDDAGGVATYDSGSRTVLGNRKAQQRELARGGQPFSESITRNNLSYGNSGLSLVSTTSGAQLIVSTEAASHNINRSSQADIESLVDRCTSTTDKSSYQYFEDQKLFRVFFAENNKFSRNVSSFADCLTTSGPGAMSGYNYQFGAVDPFNGRITSD